MFSYVSKFSVHPHCNERGSVLVIALVILLVLTLMAVTGMQTSSIQERMAGNMRDKDISFQAAEATLREAELFLREKAKFEQLKGDVCFYSYETPLSGTPQFCEYLLNIQNIEETRKPKFYVEEFEPIPEPLDSIGADDFSIPNPSLYRITAIATGGTDSSITELQSIFKINH